MHFLGKEKKEEEENMMHQPYIPLALWILDFPLNLHLQEGQMDPMKTQTVLTDVFYVIYVLL